MYVRMMLTVLQSCYVPKRMGLVLKRKLPMCRKSIFVILMVLACILIIMIQRIAMQTKHALLRFISKTVKQTTSQFVL
ncbi:hypothetical protein AYK87_21070 [Stutzerimonas stutzeri]|nr:hypothetical protein AYK87_21070 [Stutzerimonas stutzeri]